MSFAEFHQRLFSAAVLTPPRPFAAADVLTVIEQAIQYFSVSSASAARAAHEMAMCTQRARRGWAFNRTTHQDIGEERRHASCARNVATAVHPRIRPLQLQVERLKYAAGDIAVSEYLPAAGWPGVPHFC